MPETVVERRVCKLTLISSTGVGVNIGDTLQPDEYIGMCRREIMDKFLRDRANEYGADAATPCVANAMDAGQYNFAITFQERIKISEEKMEFYEGMAEM